MMPKIYVVKTHFIDILSMPNCLFLNMKNSSKVQQQKFWQVLSQGLLEKLVKWKNQ